MGDNNLTTVSSVNFNVSNVRKHHQPNSNISTQTYQSNCSSVSDNNPNKINNKILVNNINQPQSRQTQTVSVPQPLLVDQQLQQSVQPVNHMHNNSMKKKTSFQITSVTVGSSRLSNDGGDDSADDLDESHTDDISRITDNETPSFSEDTLSRDEAVVSTVIPTSAQYGLAILPEGTSTVQIPSITNHTVPNSVNITAIEEIVGSPAKSNSSRADTPNKEHAPVMEVPAPQRSERFKVVKIESTEPFRRGRWMCMDYLDHSVNQPHNSPFFKPIADVPQSTQLNGLPQTMGPMTIAPPQTLPVVQNGTVGGGGAGATTAGYQPARTVAVPTQNSPVQQQASNQQQQAQPQQIVQQSQSVPPQTQTLIQQPSSNMQATQKPAPSNQQQQQNQQQPPTVQPQPPTSSTTNIQQQSSSSQSVTGVQSTQTTGGVPSSIQSQAGAGANASISNHPGGGVNQQSSNVNNQQVTTTPAQQQPSGGAPQSSVYQQQYTINQPFTNMMPVNTSSGLLLTQTTVTTSTSTSAPLLVSSGSVSVGVGGGAPPTINTNTSQQQTTGSVVAPPPPTSQVNSQTSSSAPVAPASSQPLTSYVPASSSVFNQTSIVQSPLTSVPPLTAVSSVSVSTSTTSIPTPTSSAAQTGGSGPAQGQTYAGHPMSTQQMPVQAQSYSGQQIQHQFIPPQNYPQNIQQVNNGSNRWATGQSVGGAGDNTSVGGVATSVSGAAFTYPTSTSVFQVGGGGTPVQQAPNIIMSGGGATQVTSSSGLTRTPSLSNIQQHTGVGGASSMSVVSAPPSGQCASMTAQQHAAMLSQVQQQAAQMLMVSLSPTTTGVNVEPHTLIAAINANQLIAGGGTISTGSSIGSTNSDTVPGTGLIRPTDNNTVSNTPTPSNATAIPDDESTSAASTVAIDNKIEQAMDLVKSHLMFAVREEVEVLKEKIAELMDRINQLELENSILKANASAEVLQQLPSPCLSVSSNNNQTQTVAQQAQSLSGSASTTSTTGPGGGVGSAGNTGTIITTLTKTSSTAPPSNGGGSGAPSGGHNVVSGNVASTIQLQSSTTNQSTSTT